MKPWIIAFLLTTMPVGVELCKEPGDESSCHIDGECFLTNNCSACTAAGGHCHFSPCESFQFVDWVGSSLPPIVRIEIAQQADNDFKYGQHYVITLSDPRDGQAIAFSGWGTVTPTPTGTVMELNLGVSSVEELDSLAAAATVVLPYLKGKLCE